MSSLNEDVSDKKCYGYQNIEQNTQHERCFKECSPFERGQCYVATVERVDDEKTDEYIGEK